jgi:UDPglucose--hexose-1-phosphate uridylyltransferase
MRWHSLRQEWVVYASHRQNRTFLPPKDYSPLAVSLNPDFPTEMPAGEYEVAVFENLFPSLSPGAKEAPELIVPSRPADGSCEVVVFTQDADASLGGLPLAHIEMVLKVFAERTKAMAAKNIAYALPFENRGVEMGVTLHHPHGQIYGYPVVPPVPAQMAASMASHWRNTGRGLLADQLAEEERDGRRMIVKGEEASAFIPVCARYPYETWIMPHRPVAYLDELRDSELASLARTLKTMLLKLDGLWQRPQPYLMLFYQAPCDGAAHPEFHSHIQIYPPYRSKDRLKFLAGTELGGGMFVNDSLPEEKAAELQAVEVSL